MSGSAEKSRDAETARIVVTDSGDPVLDGAFNLKTNDGVVRDNGFSEARILARGFTYQRADILAPDLASSRGPKWLRYDYDLWLLDPFEAKPRELVAFLGQTHDIARLGEGTERGVPVTRYAGSLAVDEKLATVTGDERVLFEEELDDYWPGWRSDGVPVQLALDAAQRIRRADLIFDNGDQITIEFFDYGVDVDAEAPPATQVMAWAEYLEFLRKECEALKKKGLEKTAPHCSGGCSAGEGDSAAT